MSGDFTCPGGFVNTIISHKFKITTPAADAENKKYAHFCFNYQEFQNKPTETETKKNFFSQKTHCINPDEKCPPPHLTALQTAE